MNETIDEKRAKVAQYETGGSELLPMELFSKLSNKSTQLVNNADPARFLEGQNRAYPFEFKHPVYVASIEVQVDGYSSYKELEFRWATTRDPGTKKSKRKLNDSSFAINISDVLTSFSIRPPSEYFKQPQIKSVVVHGLALSDFETVCENLGQLERYKADVNAACDRVVADAAEARAELDAFDDRKNAVSSEISELNSQRAGIETEAEKLTTDRSELETALNQKRSEESDLIGRIEQMDDNLDKKKKDAKTLNSEIAANERELKNLKDDINMFPSEISGFVSQGATNIKRYTILTSIPILILLGVTIVLFSNAADLTVVYKTQEGVSLWTILVTRLPFVTISVVVIHACYKIAKIFIAEIMKINRQRLNLSKVSIVAKDVSDSSTEGLGFDDNEIYELRTKLKMDLLKSHLKGYVDDDYEYDLDVSLLEKFKNAKKKQGAQDEGDG